MTINGIEFPFNPHNAAHLEQMDRAYETYKAENARDRALADGTVKGSIAFIRADNASISKFLDTVLGEGAAAALGADPDDHEACLKALQLACDAISEANRGLPNRKQRREQAKKRQAKSKTR